MNSFALFKQVSEVKLELAKSIRQIRKEKEFTQQELSKRSGVSLASLKRFEQKGEISLHNLLEISKILDVLTDFDLLFNKKQDKISEKVKKSFE